MQILEIETALVRRDNLLRNIIIFIKAHPINMQMQKNSN